MSIEEGERQRGERGGKSKILKIEHESERGRRGCAYTHIHVRVLVHIVSKTLYDFYMYM